MSEEFESRFVDVEDGIEENKDKIDENERRIDDLEDMEYKLEDYKIFLYPTEIKKYIQNLVKLQTKKDDGFHSYYPGNSSSVEEYFNDLKFDSKKIKYTTSIPPNDLDYISKIISNQGWSGFSYLDNLSKNINLNKPIILYYGIIQMGAFFSNLHYNFTDYNNAVKTIKNFRSHGLDSSELKDISFNINVKDILGKRIKFEKAGLAPRFCLSYSSSLLTHFTKQISISLLDLLKNYFMKKEPNRVSTQFQKDFGPKKPDVIINSRSLCIYAISYYLSILSRYKIQAWSKLLEDKQTNIKYFIDYFLKFGKQEFLSDLFEKLYEDRDLIPQIASMSNIMEL
jgi:hypothetical protein